MASIDLLRNGFWQKAEFAKIQNTLAVTWNLGGNALPVWNSDCVGVWLDPN